MKDFYGGTFALAASPVFSLCLNLLRWDVGKIGPVFHKGPSCMLFDLLLLSLVASACVLLVIFDSS